MGSRALAVLWKLYWKVIPAFGFSAVDSTRLAISPNDVLVVCFGLLERAPEMDGNSHGLREVILVARLDGSTISLPATEANQTNAECLSAAVKRMRG